MVRNITKGVHWIPFVFSVGVVLQLLLASLGKGHGLGGTSNILVMLAFFITVGGIFFLSYRYLHNGGQISESLKKAASDIKRLSLEMQNHEILQELLGRENVFSESKLDEAFGKFREELECIEKVGAADKYNIDTKVNIEDYINEELVDSAIRADFLSQIPSTLTGLGILGTFLGLSIGLNSFELSGSAEQVQATIGPLMDGIKVAFHTSICGLCFSILYNFFYRKSHAEILESLDDFLDKFQKYVIASTDNGSANTFLKYQAFICMLLQEQTKLENAIMDRQDIRFGNLARKIDEQNKQALELYRQINESIAESQVKGIQKVVNAFVGQMNRALKGSFEELEEMAKSMCLYQKNAQGSLEAGLGQICTMYINLAEMNASLGNSVQQIKGFMDDTECMQKMLGDNLTAVRAQMEQEGETLQAQSELLQRLAVQEERLGRAITAQEKRLERTASEQEERLERAASEQEERLERAMSEQEERLVKAVAAREEWSRNMASAQEARLEKAASAQEERSSRMAEAQEKRLLKAASAQEERLKRIAEAQEERTVKMAVEQEGRIAEAVADLEERTVKIAVEQEGRIAETVAGLGERIGKAAESHSQRLSAFFEEQERQMDRALCGFTGSMQEQAAALAQMQKEAESAIRHGISSVSKTVEACQALQNESARENAEINTQMQRSVEEIAKVTENLAHYVETDIAAISKELQGLSNYTGDSMRQTEAEVLNIKQQMAANIRSVDEIIRNLHAESDIRVRVVEKEFERLRQKILHEEGDKHGKRYADTAESAGSDARAVAAADAMIETLLNAEGDEKVEEVYEGAV